jgi:DNA gyrase/topoisomerase IV subunit A
METNSNQTSRKQVSAIDTIIRIISHSFDSKDATIKIHDSMGISVMAAQYVLNMQLTELSNMDSKGIRKRLA